MTAVVWLWAAAMVVTGNTACPTPEEVNRALASLLPPGEPKSGAEARAELADEGSSLRLQLLGGNGNIQSEVHLAREGSCANMADTAAVVLAAWAARLDADVSLGFETPRAPAASPPPARLLAAPPPGPASRRWAASLAAGLFSSVEDTSGAPTFAPAGSIELRLRAVDGAWGGRVGAAATGSHERTIGAGRAIWRRLAASLGAFRRQSWGRVSLDGGVDLVASLRFLEGDGFTTVRDLRTWDVGAGGSVRLGLALGRVEPWVAAGTTVWLRPQLIEVTGVAERQRLSQLELLAGAGLTVLLSD
jgi:hypothetical protein